jgi:hypothetical protein
LAKALVRIGEYVADNGIVGEGGYQAALSSGTSWVDRTVTTSSQADAPRGTEFLYSPNRFNVATSREKCLCVVAGSPSVLEAECRTPRQMQLANVFCRYLELAAVI